MKLIIVFCLLVITLSGCAKREGPNTSNTSNNGISKETLKDGTKCALYRHSITCNWKN